MNPIIPLVELMLNVGLMLAGNAGAVPANSGQLASDLEAAANPLIAALESNSTPQADILAGYGTVIGILSALKQQTGLDPSVLARVNQYTVSSEAGISGYMIARKGFDPANYGQVPPAA